MKFEFDWKEYAKVAREMGAEGAVLLRNEGACLPIRKGETASVFGRAQLSYYKSGTGSGGMVNAPYVVSIIDGLRAADDVSINEDLYEVYAEWEKTHPFDKGVGWASEPFSQEEMPLTEELVDAAAAKSDIALVVIGRSAGEDRDSEDCAGAYELQETERVILQMVRAKFERVAVLLNVGAIIDMKWVYEYRIPAVMYLWQGGMEGGNAAADVLTGRVNPSGKLADTIVENIKDYPSTDCFGDEERNFYKEDIYVGYRYFETCAQHKVLYPFGFGLSYTDFEISVDSFASDGSTITVQALVKNVGNCPGKEVVQLYYCPAAGDLAKPEVSLIRFGKTALLAPNEEQTLTLSFTANEMASYDDIGVTGHKSCFVLEAGTYEIFIGNCVRNLLSAGTYVQPMTEVTEELEEAMAPVRAFDRLVIRGGKESYEPVPLRSVDLSERIAKNRPEALAYTGDRGYKLTDVQAGTVSMDDFLAQLSDDDLICMTRGEGMCSPKVTPGIAGAIGGVTEELKAFGIPIAGCSDGPSGIRMDCGTKAFSCPNGTLIACSFNEKLTEELYDMEGRELRKNHIDMLLGPGINIHRNPLNGRNFEYFSEDPYLTGTMAAAQLRAMHRYHVTGTIKHFACNNQERMRHTADSCVSERALREIYLRAFEICVKEAGCYSIMSTYGPVNGIWTAGNYDLLTTILRKEWGFTGIVMTDWWAKMNEEGEDGYRENTVPMVRAQNDAYMVCADAKTNSHKDNSEEGLREGRITRGELVRNAANICRVLLKSSTMEFFTGTEDEVDELHRPETSSGQIYTQPGCVLTDCCTLEVSQLHTEADSNNVYAITIPERGKYTIHLKLKSELGNLAQTTMSVFLNGTIQDSITLTGTDGEWVERTINFEVFVSVENYLNFYFAQSGIEIADITISRT